MSGNDSSFGNPRLLYGKSGGHRSTAVPLDLLASLRGRMPIPITIGGSNNVTFTVAASETRPVFLWNGADYLPLKSSVAYTWGAVSNAILSSTGAATTDVDSVLGVWYMYAGWNDKASGTYPVILRPSQTAPSALGNFSNGELGHPGTAAERCWTYVGFMECTTAATPAFRAMVKTGYWYKFAPRSIVVITDAWTAPTAATLTIPRIPGVEIGATLETGSDGQIFVGSHSASTIWDAELDISEAVASNVAAQIAQAPVQFSVNASATPFYGIAAPAGDIHILRIKDVV